MFFRYNPFLNSDSDDRYYISALAGFECCDVLQKKEQQVKNGSIYAEQWLYKNISINPVKSDLV